MKGLLIVAIVVLLNGCSANRMWFGSDVARLSAISLEGSLDDDGTIKGASLKITEGANFDGSPLSDQHIGALIAWSPEFNAAFISRGGKGCIQPATYSKANSGEVSIPAKLISTGVEEGNLTGDFSEALDKLITVTDQSTFLSIGMYGLCQLHANGGVSQSQLASLTQDLFNKASSLGGSAESSDDTRGQSGLNVDEETDNSGGD